MKNVIETSADVTTGDFHATTVVYVCDTSSSNVTITLGDVADHIGQEYVIKHKTAGNTLTVATTSSQLIDAASTWTSSTANEFVHVIGDGSKWQIVAESDTTGAVSADALTDSVHSTTLTLSSDGTDQTLTPSDGVLNLTNSSGNPYIQFGQADSYQGPSNNNLLQFYDSSGNDVWQWTADVGVLVEANQTAQFEITSALDHTGGDDIIRQMFRMSGSVSDIPGTNPAWFVQAEKVATNTETAEIIALSSDTTGGPSIRMNVTDNTTNNPTGNFKISNDPFPSGQASLDCYFQFQIQDSGGNAYRMFLEENGSFHANQFTAYDDIGGIASTNSLTGSTDTPTTDPGWTTSSSANMNAPDGYIKAYVGTQAVVLPYWNT